MGTDSSATGAAQMPTTLQAGRGKNRANQWSYRWAYGVGDARYGDIDHEQAETTRIGPLLASGDADRGNIRMRVVGVDWCGRFKVVDLACLGRSRRQARRVITKVNSADGRSLCPTFYLLLRSFSACS